MSGTTEHFKAFRLIRARQLSVDFTGQSHAPDYAFTEVRHVLYLFLKWCKSDLSAIFAIRRPRHQLCRDQAATIQPAQEGGVMPGRLCYGCLSKKLPMTKASVSQPFRGLLKNIIRHPIFRHAFPVWSRLGIAIDQHGLYRAIEQFAFVVVVQISLV